MEDGPDRDVEQDSESIVRHEEVADVHTLWRDAGAVRARKHVDYERFDELVPRQRQDFDVERVGAGEDDSGEIETLPDGSVSIPLFEEEVVVTTRTVLKERVIIRKHLVDDPRRVVADLRKERIEIERDEGVDVEGA